MLLSNCAWIVKLSILTTSAALYFYVWRFIDVRSLHNISDDISSAISTHFESTSAPSIPRKLWYKLGPSGLSDDGKSWTDTCITQNPAYTVTFLNEESGDAYVRKSFAASPEIVDMYLNLSVPILKADLLRYLLLYNEGGVWSDLDVSCNQTPIDDWVPANLKKSTALVVGMEFDGDWGNEYIRQFTSWTILAAPKSPHLLQVIDDIFISVHQKATEHNVSVSNLAMDMIGDVVDFTGPRRLTRSIYRSLSKMLNETVNELNVTFVLEPRLIGDVLVLPGFSFAKSMMEYAENVTVGAALVTHHYAGTWKNDHGGELVD